RVELDREVALDPPALGAVAVALLDAPLRVAAVEAPVPLAAGAVGAWLRIGAAHHADDQVTGSEAGARGRLGDAAERLVAQHQALAPGRCPAVVPADDLAVGPADA